MLWQQPFFALKERKMSIQFDKEKAALDAINMYNLISELEDRLAMGERLPEGIDLDAMRQSKTLSKAIIEKNLNVSLA